MNEKAEELYADIINLPHHELITKRRMPKTNRAASFAPFAALVGYDDQVKEAGRLTDEQTVLDDDAAGELNSKLSYIASVISETDSKPEISVTYFKPDERKAGGRYVAITGRVLRIDEYRRRLVLSDKSEIPIESILLIDGEMFKNLY